ncbi:helicase with zinc finger domain 2-like isoform X2 [Corticium candelabrum]|uniref:helicase with zinc finger domain 2-like isoform X2 n=1 Tax=Corticium candelabrum TaxID=121492 RepID=UPI002E26B748|nr:helicase with zinc finger domain 2-like isoform X2 [Corticium candelabrum]
MDLFSFTCTAFNSPVLTTAVVRSLSAGSMELYFPDYPNLTGKATEIRFSSLNPKHISTYENGSVTVTWSIKVVQHPLLTEKKQYRNKLPHDDYYSIPICEWKQLLLLALSESSKPDDLIRRIRHIENSVHIPSLRFAAKDDTYSTTKKEDLFYSTPTSYDEVSDTSDLISQKYKAGSLFSVQLSARARRGLLRPVIQLLLLPGSVPSGVCVEHNSKPADCFVESLRHGHNASRDRYHDIIDYANSWLPVVDHESATSCVKDSSDYVLVSGTSVRWTRTSEKVSSIGYITLTSSFSRQYSLGCREGDFLCLSYSNLVAQKARFCIEGDKVDSLLKGSSSKEVVHTDTDQCVVHCRVVDSKVEDKPEIEGAPCRQFLKVKISGERQALPEMLFNSKVPVLCTAQFISQCLPFMRMRQALQVICSDDYSNDVVKSLCSSDFSKVSCNCRYRGSTSESDRMAVSEGLSLSRQPLNKSQFIAVKLAMKQDITLIQGPPGTGKTVTGAHIAVQFLRQRGSSSRMGSDEKVRVLYCCPSNQTVDDITDRLKNGSRSTKILRVYGEGIEKKRFPGISIFEKIRNKATSSYGQLIMRHENEFRQLKMKEEMPTENQVSHYKDIVSAAEQEQIDRADVLLCTCIQAGSPRMTKHCVTLCIVDEAGQSFEPETLVAISRARKIVLIGDHKQLQPVVLNRDIGSQLSRSMFERIAESAPVKEEKRVHMLNVQYRMHYDICEFPSIHFYEGKLETAPELRGRPLKGVDFWNRLYPCSKVGRKKQRRKCFIHVEGEERTNRVSGEGTGGEESKYNLMEAGVVVDIVKRMTRHKCRASDIRVITPYTAQRAYTENLLRRSAQTQGIEVSSVFGSQGSESEFIILSTVRSLPNQDLVDCCSKKWMREHFGFIADEHQMNVALTRAKQGLIIVGNGCLLQLHTMWRKLIDHYKTEDCYMENWKQTFLRL